MSNRRFPLVGLLCLLVIFGLTLACSGDAVGPVATPAARSAVVPATRSLEISTAAELYAAINDPANAGREVVVAPGVYLLDETQANGGRLELQKDMTIRGQPGHPEAVVIDASSLSSASLTSGGMGTGAVRLGRGSNALAWLTVRNAVNGAAAVSTDLFLEGPTTITIAHVIASGSPRGIDVRNVGAAAAGRVLEVVLTDNELADNNLGAGQGLRVTNLAGADGATIHATLRRNLAHGSIAGCLVANVNTEAAIIEVDSRGDRFEDNGNGCVILGGNASGAGTARDNVVRFSAQASAFEHNLGPLGPAFPARAGLAAYGGVSTTADRAFDNRVEVTLQAVRIDDNGGPDVAAWGAISSAVQPAGSGNTVAILLQGSAKKANVQTVDSAPTESAGTDKVTVMR